MKRLYKVLIPLFILVILTSCLKINKEYDVVFDYDYDNTSEVVTINYNDKVLRPEDPHREGFIFDNWYLNEEVYDFNLLITKNIKLVAKWLESIKYRVVFDYNYDDIKEVFEVNDNVNFFEDPLREGYEFLGWYLEDDDTLFDFNSIITENMVIYAKWEEVIPPQVYYQINFNSNGGSNKEPISVLEGSKITKPDDPYKEGYEFLGWYIEDSNALFDFKENINEDLNLYAKWELKYYIVRFLNDDGTVLKKLTVTINDDLLIPEIEDKEGYIFLGWSLKNSDTLYDFNEKINSNLVLYAKWELIYYTVKFLNNDGTILEELNVTINDDILLPNGKEIEGCLFLGWYYLDKKIVGTFKVSKDTLIYSKYKEISNLNGDVDIYYINDLHGALSHKDDELGLDHMANVILPEQEDKDVLFIAGGDILQGQLESNHFYGESIIYTLNEMNLDAFVIGNHEFDWGLDKVLSYFNGENNIQANYPLLGANVFLKSTNELPNGISPYTIVNKNGLDILIIGVIGYGLESSIDGSLVKDYYFADPTPIVRRYINEFKDEVDLIVVANHGDSDYFNQNAANDGANVILNGHTHKPYIKQAYNKPILQTGSSGHYLGKVTVKIKNNVITSTAENLTPQKDNRLYNNKEEITEIINYYLDQIAYKYETILISERNYSVNDLAFYIAKVMRIITDSDIAFHNSGGTRTSLSAGEEISESTILNIFPFDNFIITVNLKGSEINKFLSGEHGSINDKRPEITTFESEKTYKVAVHSYTFNFESNPFMWGDNIVHTNIVLRDAISEALINQKNLGYTYFNINTPITFADLYTSYYDEEKDFIFS